MKVVARLELQKLGEIGKGEGRNSHVFLARDPQLGDELVLKEIPKASIKKPSDLFTECNKIHASRHRNVLPVQYGCETTDLVCIAMPYCRAGSLAPRIAAGPMSVSQVVQLGVDMLSGLGAVHAAQVVHLDIKPTNVLFADTGQALLADFGQSAWIDPATGLATNLAELYIRAVPPELLKAGVATVLSDIYQVGLTLYRAVNGEPHYRKQVAIITEPTGRARDRAIKSGSFPDRNDFLPHVPQGLCNLIRDALAVEPAKRPQSALELRERLARVSPQVDWEYTESADLRSWIGNRLGKRDLLVEQRFSNGTADIAVYTVNAVGEKRRKTELCTSVASDRADVELRSVFRQLAG